MELRTVLKEMRTLHHLPRLVAALGHEPLWDSLGGMPEAPGSLPARVVGRTGTMPWIARASVHPERAARATARRLATRGRLAAVLVLDPEARRLAVSVAFDDCPTLVIEGGSPDPVALRQLARLASQGDTALAWTTRAAEALRSQSAGRRFFLEFRRTLERMTAAAPGALRAADRRAYALLQLTRVLFLYFVQAKGWLDGRDRFLAESVDACLRRRRRIHRDLLRPLFFGTLNRPAAERSRAARGFGAIPFLNGGLFEPHPLDRRARGDVPNDVWRDAFDGLFERFHFTVAEGEADGRIAPDMLGRVFEGVMAPDVRRASGTYYTPARLVGEMIEAALAGFVAPRLACSETRAARLLAGRDPLVWPALESATILDPAVGSGAFLLGALERLAALAPGGDGSDARRRILRGNLYGVDRSAGAVRLTELRLWLAVIAPDRSDRPDRVAPLPNLDCLVRQGDSLVEPVTAGLRLPAEAAGVAHELAAARRAVVEACGPGKRIAVRRLADLETRVTATALAAAEERHTRAVALCLRDARTRDLFGHRRGLDRNLCLTLAEQRRALREVRRARRIVARDHEVPWFHYQCHFADVFTRGGFDLVVGNPPWLRAEELPAEVRRRLAGRYRWWVAGGRGYGNRADLSVAFLERAVELAAAGGVVALLLPAKLATAGYGAAARHALASETTLLRVADLGARAAAAFDATVYPLALVTRKARPEAPHRVAASLVSQAPRVPQRRLAGGGPWILAREPVRRALDALAGDHPRLDSLLVCRLGLKTGANAVFLDPPEDIEPELIRRAVRGRDVRAFGVRGSRRLLYTHAPNGRPLPSLPPRAAAWIARHGATLRARADHAGGPLWTLFRTEAAGARHRVVWADLARRLSAAALTGASARELVPLNTCYVAATGSAEEAERITAWLNSSWLRAAARAGAVPAASGFARYTATVVGALPYPPDAMTCPRLPALAAAGRRGEPIQEELDDLVATRLALSVLARRALARFLARSPGDRG